MSEALTLQDSERQPCEVWTRVMGYHRPVSAFNVGKKAEFRQRVFFHEDRAIDSAYHGMTLEYPDCAIAVD